MQRGSLIDELRSNQCQSNGTIPYPAGPFFRVLKTAKACGQKREVTNVGSMFVFAREVIAAVVIFVGVPLAVGQVIVSWRIQLKRAGRDHA